MFSINETTGALNFVTAPDFDNPTDSNTYNTYDIIIRASYSNETTSSSRAIDYRSIDVTQTIAITIDNTAPTIAITDDDADNSLSAGDTSTLTFNLSEASSNFIESDVTISGGSLSNWTAFSSTVYTATFTPTTNSTTDGVISVASSKFSDAAGNTNNDGSNAYNSLTVSIDSTTSSPSPAPSPSPEPSPSPVPSPSPEPSPDSDCDGVRTTTKDALATLAVSQGVTGDVGDINNDGTKDSEQSALATFVWRSVTDFKKGNVGALTDHEAMISICALSTNNHADDQNLQLNNIQILDVHDSTTFGSNLANSVSINRSTGKKSSNWHQAKLIQPPGPPFALI